MIKSTIDQHILATETNLSMFCNKIQDTNA